MNSWLFPPQTREVQFDEKWAFVGKKEKHCDPENPDDAACGDNWDHVALDRFSAPLARMLLALTDRVMPLV